MTTRSLLPTTATRAININLKKNVNLPVKKFDFPTVDETVIWRDLKLIIEHEWIDKLWRDNRCKLRLQKILNQSQILYHSYTDQLLIEKLGYMSTETDFKLKADLAPEMARFGKKMACFPCLYPFKVFHGILHYILISTEDLNAQHRGPDLDAIVLQALKECNAIENESKDNFLYFEETQSRLFVEQQQRQLFLLSDILDATQIPNVFHIFIQSDRLYWDDIRWGNISAQPLLFDEVIHYNKTNQHHKLGRSEVWMRKYHYDREARKRGKQSQTPAAAAAAAAASNRNESEPEPEPEPAPAPAPKFKGVKDRILVNEFDFPYRLNQETNCVEAIIDEQSPQLMWGRNAYPYWFLDGVQHNLVWYLCSTEEAMAIVDRFIVSELDKTQTGLSYEYWENPAELKSIPDFNHFQVLSVDMLEYKNGIGAFKVVEKAYEWNELCLNTDIAEKHVCDMEFGRSERVCREYHSEWTENMKRFESERDVVLRRVFDYDLQLNADTNKLRAVVKESANGAENECKNDDGSNIGGSAAAAPKWKFVENRYPYNLDENTRHFMLFSTEKNGLSNGEVQDIIETQSDINIEQYLFFAPMQENKGIHDLWYVHVFIHES